MEERCAAQIQEREEGKETQRVLIQTAVPDFIGLDHEAVMKQIHQKNKDDIFFPSDGFHDAMSGISRAEEIQAQTDASFFLNPERASSVSWDTVRCCADI